MWDGRIWTKQLHESQSQKSCSHIFCVTGRVQTGGWLGRAAQCESALIKSTSSLTPLTLSFVCLWLMLSESRRATHYLSRENKIHHVVLVPLNVPKQPLEIRNQCSHWMIFLSGARNETQKLLLKTLHAHNVPCYHHTLGGLLPHFRNTSLEVATRMYLRPGVCKYWAGDVGCKICFIHLSIFSPFSQGLRWSYLLLKTRWPGISYIQLIHSHIGCMLLLFIDTLIFRVSCLSRR